MTEKDAESKLINDILACDIKLLLTDIANDKFTTKEDKQKFIEKYLQPHYYMAIRIKSKIDEYDQDNKIGSKIYRT